MLHDDQHILFSVLAVAAVFFSTDKTRNYPSQPGEKQEIPGKWKHKYLNCEDTWWISVSIFFLTPDLSQPLMEFQKYLLDKL